MLLTDLCLKYLCMSRGGQSNINLYTCVAKKTRLKGSFFSVRRDHARGRIKGIKNSDFQEKGWFKISVIAIRPKGLKNSNFQEKGWYKISVQRVWGVIS